MKHFIFAVFIGCMIFATASACHPASGSPRTWIDQPLEDSIFPIETLILQAHASDSDGISEIQFLIDSKAYKTVSVSGNRMEHAAVEWLPPAYGEYLIGAKAVDQNGVTGSIDTSKILISADALIVPLPLPGPEVDPLPLPVPEVEPVPLPDPQDIEEATDPVVIANRNANCREGPGTEYDIDGALLLDEQADVVGRLADNSWFLITLPDSSLNCWISAITVGTEGNIAGVSIASAPPPPAEEAPPGDTKPPGIFGAAPSKNSMCASGTVNSNVVAYDEGGIDKVYANWQITNGGGAILESGYVEFGPISSIENGYTGVFGPFSYPGSLSIQGKVVDNAGNSTSFSHTIIIDCS